MTRTAYSRQFTICLLAIAFIAVSGCSAQVSPDTLIGTYGVQNNGKTELFLRIVRKDGRYLLSEKISGKWATPINAIPLSQSTLHAYIKTPISVAFAGLGNNKIAVYKMPPGWNYKGFITKTGYWAATVSGPVALYKMKAGATKPTPKT